MMESADRGYGTINRDPVDNVYCKGCRWHHDSDWSCSMDWCQPFVEEKRTCPINGPYTEYVTQSRAYCETRNRNFNCRFYEKLQWLPNWCYKLKWWK